MSWLSVCKCYWQIGVSRSISVYSLLCMSNSGQSCSMFSCRFIFCAPFQKSSCLLAAFFDIPGRASSTYQVQAKCRLAGDLGTSVLSIMLCWLSQWSTVALFTLVISILLLLTFRISIAIVKNNLKRFQHSAADRKTETWVLRHRV